MSGSSKENRLWMSTSRLRRGETGDERPWHVVIRGGWLKVERCSGTVAAEMGFPFPESFHVAVPTRAMARHGARILNAQAEVV